MSFDVPTLVVVTIFMSTIAGALLFLSWLQNRSVTALACWSSTYLLGAAGIALIGSRGHIADFWSINIANALIATGGGSLWAGLRMFEGRRVHFWQVFIGAFVWLAACGIEPFYHSITWRIALGSLILTAYVCLCFWELWSSRHERLMFRWPAMALLAFHGSLYVLRVIATIAADLPSDTTIFAVRWLPFGIFEALFFSVSMAFVLIMMAKERVENKHRRAAFIDPLTGIPNRRGFIDNAQLSLDDCRRRHAAASLVIFDLDHFKAINDTHGHQVGDDILAAFCRVAEARFSGSEIFARLGGEEFVLLLPELAPEHAKELADRIRMDFSVTAWVFAGKRVRATVSAGICSAQDCGYDLTRLMSAADQSLYRAKANGRNRIEAPKVALALVRNPTTARETA